MVDVVEIEIGEFKKDIYSKYTKLFPKEEQREWKKIENTYNEGIEKFYKIIWENKTIGFFMLERINEDYPYYLDYFAIFKEFQNQGFGSKAIKKLITKIGVNNALIGEIEKENINDPITVKRFLFYSKLGFKKIASEYLLYNVFYTPLIYTKNKRFKKKEMDKIFFEYYLINCGEKEVKRNCKIIA